jgi:hypothetical protein
MLISTGACIPPCRADKVAPASAQTRGESDGPGSASGCAIRSGHTGATDRKSNPLEQKFFALADCYEDSRDKDVRKPALALLKYFGKFLACS